MAEFVHVPVLLKEVTESFNLKSGDQFLDATVGGGGHAKELLSKNPQIKKYIAIDQDADALVAAKQTLSSFSQVQYKHTNYENVPKLFAGQTFGGILADIGVSSYQIDTASRGFSFQKDGPLDMRLNKDNSLSAEDVVNNMPQTELANIIYRYGEEKDSRRIASAIVNARKTQKKLKTIGE